MVFVLFFGLVLIGVDSSLAIGIGLGIV